MAGKEAYIWQGELHPGLCSIICKERARLSFKACHLLSFFFFLSSSVFSLTFPFLALTVPSQRIRCDRFAMLRGAYSAACWSHLHESLHGNLLSSYYRLDWVTGHTDKTIPELSILTPPWWYQCIVVRLSARWSRQVTHKAKKTKLRGFLKRCESISWLSSV